MDIAILVLCLTLTLALAFLIAFCIRYGTFEENYQDMLLVIPLDKDSNVEMKLKRALLICENSVETGIKIVAIDLGMSDDGRKIFELFSREHDYIKLYTDDELKNIFSVKKTDSKTGQNSI